jgi:ABC-2 type transport system ATP-binding protein
MNVIEIRGLSKTYGRIHALDHLSASFAANKITGLIGRNGAGKTTLLKLIAGYLRPNGGELKVLSQSPFNNLKVSANSILVNDNMTFPETFMLSDILKEIAPFYANWQAPLAEALFDYFRLNPQQRHSNLSKGTKSTFNAIIGIASRCPVTLFDEPTSGMDSAVRKDFYRALLKDYLDAPRTIILSSHLLGELDEILEDILLIDQGKEFLHLPVLEIKEYALGLRGNTQVLRGCVAEQDIIYQEEFGKDSLYLVVKATSLEGKISGIKAQGIEAVPVPIDDLCNYLTSKTKGGINDVFKRD